MKIIRIVGALLLVGAIAAPLVAQPKAKKRLLVIGESKGYQHDAVSAAMATLWKLGKNTGLWDTYIRTDTQLVTKKKLTANAKNLNYFDAVLFYTSGELPMDESQKADLLSFIHDDGKGFLGAHSATDTFHQWPAYGDLIGGYFDGHPWGTFQAPIIVEDSEFPAMKHFAPVFTIHDEIYQIKDFSRERVRVLMRLDASKLDMTKEGIHRTDGDFPVAWVRNCGKGRMFYCGLGHSEEAWDDLGVQKMWIEAVKWAMGLIPGDATPREKP